MELLFYWITGTNPSTISSPQGFNLSPKYDFHIGCEKEEYFLYENKNWENHLSVFDSENIVNLTTIVGENGVGKTTILKSILSHAEQMHDESNNGLNDYGVGAYPNKRIEGLGDPIMFVLVGLIRDKLHIYYSLPVLDYSRVQKLNPKVHAIGGRKRSDLYLKNDFPFQDTTIIYMTNSVYESTVKSHSYYEGIHSLGLTPKTLERLSRDYYDTMYGLTRVYPYHRMGDSYLEWEWLLCRNKEDLFQDFLHVMFYHRLLSEARYSEMKGKMPIDFSIALRNAPRVFMEYVNKIDDKDVFLEEVIKRLFVVFSESVNNWKTFIPEYDLFTRVLYMNLVCEIITEDAKKEFAKVDGKVFLEAFKYAVQSLSENRWSVTILQDGSASIQEYDSKDNEEQILDKCNCIVWPFPDGVEKIHDVDAWIREKLSTLDTGFSDYIKKALEEVGEILKVTVAARERYKQMWEANSESYDFSDANILRELSRNNFSMSFRYDWKRVPIDQRGNDGMEYKDLIKTIAGFAEQGNSFVLRYLDVKTYGMSSGERSFLNFLSWLSELPPMIDRMDVKNSMESKRQASKIEGQGLKEDILFLFDEPDLYMHPQWQKNLISNLIDELKYPYKGKRVQVIMTTSSPLVLSDVPVENTVYMRKDKMDGIVIDGHRRDRVEQTFGADIYKLFADSFFLKDSPMGKFAEDYINNEILKPLNEMRIGIWKWEIRQSAKDDTYDAEMPDIEEYNKKLEQLEWKIEMLANEALYKKAHEMYEEIMEWCANDTNKLSR